MTRRNIPQDAAIAASLLVLLVAILAVAGMYALTEVTR